MSGKIVNLWNMWKTKYLFGLENSKGYEWHIKVLKIIFGVAYIFKILLRVQLTIWKESTAEVCCTECCFFSFFTQLILHHTLSVT